MQTLPQPREHPFAEPIVFAHSGLPAPVEAPEPEEETSPHMGLTEVEERLLRSIYDLHYLTIVQISRLHYSSESRSSLNYVASLMKRLEEEHYVQRGYLARAVAFGRNPSVFRLATKGINHMAGLGLSPIPKFRPSGPFPSFENLKHTLCVNDVIIAARRLVTEKPGYTLREVRHDWMLHHTPVYVPADKRSEGKVAVIPDAWLDIYGPPPAGKTKEVRMPVHLELDRGTEDTAHSFKPKFAARVAYINGAYEQFFHTPYVTIAYATTRGQHRCERMRTWAEEELTRLKRTDDSHFFYFTSLPTLTDPLTGRETETLDLDPDTLFLTPVWTTPFDPTPKALLVDN